MKYSNGPIFTRDISSVRHTQRLRTCSRNRYTHKTKPNRLTASNIHTSCTWFTVAQNSYEVNVTRNEYKTNTYDCDALLISPETKGILV